MKSKITFHFLRCIAVVALVFSLFPLTSNKTYADSQFLYWPVPDNTNQIPQCDFGCYPNHGGIDISVNTSSTTPIYAAAGGKVITVVNNQPYGVGRNPYERNGNYVVIDHENGYVTYYLHMSQNMKVSYGQKVVPGALLGYGSNSGMTCGNQLVGSVSVCPGSEGIKDEQGSYFHLHFQVNKNGTPVNPKTNYLWVRNLNDNTIANPPSFHPFDKSARTGQFVGLGKCMDLSGANQTNGNPIILYDCYNNNSAQLWMYEPSTKLLRLENNRSKCLELGGSNTNNGAGINIWECLGNSNQRWNITPQGELKSDYNINKCIDIAGGNSANGTRLQIYDCNGSAAQKWTVSANPIYSINSLCIDDAGGLLRTGDDITTYHCNGTNAQKWFYNQSTQELKSVNGKCIDRASAGTYDGTRIQLFDCNGSIAQKWRFEGGNIKDVQVGKCLDGNNLTAGSRLHLWTCYGGLNQNWHW